jgi:hypothetical protein
MKNLAVYYGAPPLGWSASPAFLFHPQQFLCPVAADGAQRSGQQ